MGAANSDRTADPPEGLPYVAKSDSEMHHLLKQVFFNAIRLPPPDCDDDTRDLRYVRAFKPVCSSPEPDAQWSSMPGKDGAPGPFEQAWKLHEKELSKRADSARRI